MESNDRLGRCYELSGKYILDSRDDSLILVHGVLTNRFEGAEIGKTIGHAWIENPKDDTVYDPVMDRVFDRYVYYVLFKLKQRLVTRELKH